MDKNFKVLGIDQSMTNTSVVFINYNGDSEDVFFCSIKPKTKNEERLVFIYDEIQDILEKEEYDLIILEGYSFFSKYGLIYAGEIGGIIRVLLKKLNKKFIIVQPTQLKKFISGKGVSKKEEIMKEIYKKYKVDISDNNVADAFVLAKIGLQVLLLRNKLISIDKYTNYEKEVLSKIMGKSESISSSK